MNENPGAGWRKFAHVIGLKKEDGSDFLKPEEQQEFNREAGATLGRIFGISSKAPQETPAPPASPEANLDPPQK